MKLKSFLMRQGLTEAAFAAKVGLSQAAINRYCRGVRLPRAEHIAAIEKATDGRVRWADFNPNGAAK